MASAATAVMILLHGIAARFLLNADESFVYFRGHVLQYACSFRKRFGAPCPTCGMTRSVVLSLHGHLLRAWRVAPGGPALVVGGLAIVLGLLVYSTSLALDERLGHQFRPLLVKGVLLSAAGVILIWSVGWSLQFSSRH